MFEMAIFKIIFGVILMFHGLECAELKNNRDFNLTVYQFSTRVKDHRQTQYDKGDFDGGINVIQDISDQLLQYMDPEADPCEDFYQFVCGNFGHVRNIPDHLGSYGEIALQKEYLDSVLEDLLCEDIEDTGDDSFEAFLKVRRFYQSCVDADQRESRGVQPLLDLVEKLGGWHVFDLKWRESRFDYTDIVGKMAAFNVKVFLSTNVEVDTKDPNNYVISLDQASPFPFPHPDLAENMPLLKSYKEFVEDVLVLMEVQPEQVNLVARDIFEVGLLLSRLDVDKRNSSDPSANMRRTTLEELHTKIPGFDWQRYLWILFGKRINPYQPVLLKSVQYLIKLPEILYQIKPKTMANYMFWKLTEHFLDFLDDRFVEAKVKFEEDMSGMKNTAPVADRLLDYISKKISKPLSSVYLRRHFYRQHKQDSLQLAKEIRDAFKSLIREKDWLDETTKIHALKKLNSLNIQTGYPADYLFTEKINREFDDLQITTDKCFENAMSVELFWNKRLQRILEKKVDRNDWSDIAPIAMNAYYERSEAKVIIPAAFLRPPFFHRRYPRSLNYGSIGTMIGHEIAHGFDRQGRLYDERGRLENKWSNSSIKTFESRVQCFIDQYNQYSVHGENVEGKGREDENISDLGGVRAAFRAYKKWLDRNRRFRAEQTLPNLPFSGEQLFFIQYAHFWCGVERREDSSKMIQADIHAPHQFRVIGPLSNSREFSKAFKCPKGTFMNPDEKCSLW